MGGELVTDRKSPIFNIVSGSPFCAYWIFGTHTSDIGRSLSIFPTTSSCVLEKLSGRVRRRSAGLSSDLEVNLSVPLHDIIFTVELAFSAILNLQALQKIAQELVLALTVVLVAGSAKKR